ncbi:hypothetical protein COEREDRAFT_80708 [Coemansia reversa NRRL 1564]|uniref:Copper transporter n=1 Tax=Coemansia reversa (strain ATCC 12441 / NRRL 1564) TaxID=763665 RepID=A0A2G5BD79_COERN|nr:hypothetical protein COEREDRAFT_80708 [Coemansia reversa NRRL 1564]|eukprot:PIA16974.1 hypothetical protein COEREDRAFT_80708 [Coemansia reversa NRRL 1564]
MDPSLLLDSFQEAHRHLLTRDTTTRSIYLGLVFKAYNLRTTSQFALAYFFLIVLGIAERLFSFAIDNIRDKPGQPWRIFPRACIYYVVTMIRYVLMIAIMNVYIPMFLVICLGLTLGQIIVETIRYFLMMRQLRIIKNSRNDSVSSESLKNSLLDISSKMPPRSNHIGEPCC